MPIPFSPFKFIRIDFLEKRANANVERVYVGISQEKRVNTDVERHYVRISQEKEIKPHRRKALRKDFAGKKEFTLT